MKRKKHLNFLALLFLVFTMSIIFIFPAAAAEKKEILIGAPISMTGIHSMAGLEQKWAYELAIEEVNKKGGIQLSKSGKKLPVKLVVADDEGEPGKAAAAVEKLIKLDKVDLLMSDQSGSLVVPACIVAEKYKKFMAANTCFPFMWTPNNFKWSSLMFFHADAAAEVPFKLWKSLPADQQPKAPALIMEDSPDGQGFAQGFLNFAKQYGFEFVVNEPMAVGAKDYSSQVLKMKLKKADAVLMFGSPTDSVTFVRQMNEAGLKMRYVHGWKGTWTSEFSTAMGKDADGILCDGFWSEDLPYPGAKEVGQKYQKKFNKHSVSVGLFYANAQILMAAIEKAGTVDSEAVRNAIIGHEFKGTVMGDITFDKTGLAVTASTAHQWKDGKQELVFPIVEGGYKLKINNL